MAGIDRVTGQLLDNYSSALQSVALIFVTRIGERVMLRHFGAGMVELLGRRMKPSLFAAMQVLIVAAIDLWEPRFRVRRVLFSGSVDQIRLGAAGIDFEVDWRPRGHLGDFTVEGVRRFSLFLVNGNLEARAQ